MGRDEDRARLAGCPRRGCTLHAERAGCRLLAGVPAPHALALVEPSGGLDQEGCTLLELLLNHLRPAHAPGASGAAADDTGPAALLSELFLVLHRVASARASAAVTVGYLVTAVRTARVDRRRRDLGRPRCGICRHYGWISRRCLERDAPYAEELPPGTEPGRLSPPCTAFRSVHAHAPVEPAAVRARDEPDPSERVARALAVLERTDPVDAALLVRHHLDGVSLRTLAREAGTDRRHLARRLHRAEELLGFVLEDLA